MSPLLKDGKYKVSEKEPDSALDMNLRQWIMARPRLLDPELLPLFERLHEFASHVESEGFVPALKHLAGDVVVYSETVDLTELIGEKLCRGISAGGNGIERKSVQEMLYFCTGIVPDLPAAEFGKRIEAFLAFNGSKGLIRVFLSVHLSNLIFTDLHDSLKASHPEVVRGRMEAIERICQKAAAAAVRSLNTWSEPDPSSVATLLSDLKTGIMRTLGGGVSFHRGA
jgi:hypothetical protein